MAPASASPAHASPQVAITFDDLPYHGPDQAKPTRYEIAAHVLDVLKQHGLKEVYGFVNGVKAEWRPDTVSVLKEWVQSGHYLGNHTYTHPDLAASRLEDYIADLQRNEPLLSSYVPEKIYKVFRFPFLSEGDTPEKRNGFRQYLSKNGYRTAEVSLDFLDWGFVEPYVRCLGKHDNAAIDSLKKAYLAAATDRLRFSLESSQKVFGRDIPLVLLLHLNSFTSLMLDPLLQAYKAKGVNFVTLNQALSDPAYAMNPGLASKEGKTFLSMFLEARGLPYPALGKDPLAGLDQVCK